MSEDSFAVQRRSKRKPAQITVTLAIEGDEAEQLASAIDLSQHGLRLQTDHLLAPGQRVKLLMGGDPYYALGARVVWLGKMDSEEKGQAGLEFLKPLPTPV